MGWTRAFFICCLWGATSVALPTEAEIDDLFDDYQGKVPGAAVTVIKDGWVVYKKAFGLADVNTQTAANTNTNFRLASVTKQFTAAAILVLVDQGKLTFDTKLTEIFPDFPSYGSAITVRHLLNHTSGLRDYENLIPGGQTQQVLDSDVLRLLKKQSSGSFKPGSQYSYSNSGYCVLGEIVTKVSGQSFASFLKEFIFDRIGMRETVAFEKGISQVNYRAYGHSASGGGWKQTDQSITSATLGDGGVYTSIEDYFYWDQALNTSSFVSPALLAEAFTPGKLNDGSSIKYGFGWVLDTYGGRRRQSHTGSTIGFRTAVQRFPAERLTVVVLVNRANAAPWDKASQIADKYLR